MKGMMPKKGMTMKPEEVEGMVGKGMNIRQARAMAATKKKKMAGKMPPKGMPPKGMGKM